MSVMKVMPKNAKAMSLVEILISIMIFCTVMMTFAMVFPSGYRLNKKSRNETTAARLANGIMDKIQNVEFSRADLLVVDSDTPTIENLRNWDSAKSAKFAKYFDLNKMPENFFLPDEKKPVQNSNGESLVGIEVVIPETDPTFAYITVRIAWNESNKTETITKFTTLTTCRSSNRK
jgi:type II secretory pathway pseudopilin PulG